MDNQGKDLALWVGRQFYPTSLDYISEALRLGCCRKIPKMPANLVVGETCVYLLHREATGAPGFLFGWYVVDWVIQCSKMQAVVDEVRGGVHITAIGSSGRSLMQPRGCGELDPPSLYLVGPEDMTQQLGLRPFTGRNGKIHLIKPPLNLGGLKHFRGFRYMETIMDLVG